MNVRRLSALLACACAVAVMLALPAVADAAYTTNTECLSCHDAATGSGAISKVDFTASPGAGNVDYTKCKACHWIDPSRTTHGNFNHQHVPGIVFPTGSVFGGSDCPTCHGSNTPGYGDVSRFMTTSTPDGWFATATPRSTSPARMHAIHVNGSWPRSVSYTAGCASCHESAACTACHTIPPVGHADHTRNAASGTYAYPPVAYTVGIGTPVTNPDLATATTMTLTCVNASCHARTAVGTVAFDAPSCPTCHADRTAAHGYESIDHVADNGATLEQGSTTPCGACHSTDLMTEHAKATSTGPRSCATCHPSPRDSFTSWDQGCDQCHGLVAPDPRHSGEVAKHAGAGSSECTTCHSKTLEAIHASATTTIGEVTYTACLVCHNDATSLPGKTCESCHFTMDGHPAPAAAHTAVSSDTCAVCHDADTTTPGVDIGAVHAKLSCATCHNNPGRIGDFSTKTAECSSCHTYTAADGRDHKDFAAKHAVTADSSACWKDCHTTHYQAATIADDLIHTKASIAAGTCPRCHNETFDLTGKTATCTTCHGDGPGLVPIHSRYPERHIASTTPSLECTGCHFSDVKDHQTSYGCNLCHLTPVRGGNAQCAFCHSSHNGSMSFGTPMGVTLIGECGNVNCHGEYGTKPIPSAEAHYAAHSAEHTATPTDSTCEDCHSMGLKEAHASVADPCVTCHNSPKFAALAKPWDKSCEACHATKHAGAAVKHAPTASAGCTGLGCHDIGDVASLHRDASMTTTGGTHLTSCQVCHKNADRALPATADCGGCHAGHGDISAQHTGFASASTTCVGAPGCHANRLMPDIHAPFVGAGKAFSNTCDLCHKNAALDAKLAAKGLDWKTNPPSAQCSTCHDYVGDPHAGSNHLATSAGSTTCLTCHGGGSNDVQTVHGAYADLTKCATCHNNASYGGDITSNKTSGDCEGCHPAAKHADLHESSLGVADVVMGSANSDHSPWTVTVDCRICHSGNLVTEHKNNCAACHSGANAAGSLGTWGGTCQQGACHPSIHALNHDALYWNSSASCDGCHSGYPSWPGDVDCAGCHALRDFQPPTTTSNALPAYLGPARVTLSASDPWPSSGIARTYAKIDGAAAVATTSIDFAPPASGTAEHAIEYWSVDNAGLEEVTHNTVTFSVTNDGMPPRTTSDAKASYMGIARIALTATDDANQYGVKATYYVLDGGPQTAGTSITIPNPDATTAHTLEFWSVDYSGNEEIHNHAEFTCSNDSAPPVSTAQISAKAVVDGVPWITFYRVWITLLATDVGDSGVVASYGMIDGIHPIGGPSTGRLFTNSANDYTFEEGFHTLDYWSVDAAGNAEEPQHMVWGEDWHGPTVTNDIGVHTSSATPYVGTARVTLTAIDEFSGPKEVRYRVDHAATVTVGPVSTVVVPAPASGTASHLIEWWATDNVGNEFGSYGNTTFYVKAGPTDSTPPAGTMSVNDGAEYASSASVNVDSAVTDGESGMSQMCVDPGTGTFGPWVAYAADQAISLPAGDGPKTVRAQYKDVAGNTTTLSDTITLDTHGPSGTMVIAGDAPTTLSTAVSVASDVYDAGSGVHQMRIDPGTGTFGDWMSYAGTVDIALPAGDGPKTVNVEFSDRAGNTTVLSDMITLVPNVGTLSGHVTGSGGLALSGATVSIGGQSTTTASDGSYSFADLLPDTYSVTASATGYVTQIGDGVVTGGGTTVVDFSLAVATGSLSGRITSSSGTALAGATVTTDQGQTATSDGTGAYTIASLAPGSYTLTASLTGYTPRATPITIMAGTATQADVALAPASLASGRLFTASRSVSGFSPGAAGDDDLGTFWWSSATGARNDIDWLKVDLGSIERVARIEVVWQPQHHARKFIVYTSEDGLFWNMEYGTQYATGGTTVIAIPGGRLARYVRVDCKFTAGADTGYGIAELLAFR